MVCRYATPAVLIVAALTQRAAAVPQLATAAPAPLVGLGHMSRAFQLSCHSSGDAVSDLPVLSANLAFVQGVCCSQLDETCGLSQSLPTACGEPACARVVELVSEKCGPLLSAPDCFYCGGFKEALDVSVHACADVHAQRTTYTMADPTLRLSPIATPGRLTDGMGVPGHRAATGQERVTIRAPTGQRVAFQLETQWLGSGDVLYLYDGVDESKELAKLRGTVLPANPLFISSGEEMRVVLVTADIGEGVASSFSALFEFACNGDAGCGGRGKCTEGRCVCQTGYFGDSCENLLPPPPPPPTWLRHKDGHDYLVLTGTGENFQNVAGGEASLCHATTAYSAARLMTEDPHNLYLDTHDTTFATTTVELGRPGCIGNHGATAVGLSEVSTCDWSETTTATVDLSGTPFALDLAKAQRSYLAEGWEESLAISCSDARNQVCSFVCGGACGECYAAEHRLPLVSLDNDYDPCSNNPCGAHGTCHSTAGNWSPDYHCVCDSCDHVPLAQCQDGCSPSWGPDGQTRNWCDFETNAGWYPSSCL